MRTLRWPMIAVAVAVTVHAAPSARAQPGSEPAPVPEPSGLPEEREVPAEDAGDAPADGAPAPAPDPVEPPHDAPPPEHADGWAAQPQQPRWPEPAPGRPAREVHYPELFNAPTGRLLGAGILYSSSGLDTGGGLSSSLRVGLGDVAEFGLSLTDVVRARYAAGSDAARIYPYVTATFKMGVDEHRLFRHQPALALGFRKSFEHEDAGFKTRIAELYLVGSKRLGPRAEVHAGGVFWDASLEGREGPAFVLHSRGVKQQLRAFGGIELRPLDDASILLELMWVPEFCYTCQFASEKIDLTALFSWGVRYQVADWLVLESGVRLPNIDDVNLLDAQIFGQVKFVSRALRRTIDNFK